MTDFTANNAILNVESAAYVSSHKGLPSDTPAAASRDLVGLGLGLLQRNKLTIFTVVTLLALLAWAFWTMVQMWNSVEGSMGIHEVVAMWLGIFFSCVVGFGLMGLVFYSSRAGYDEAPIYIQEDGKPDDGKDI